jgi:methyltransferase-like protein/SAM-dependent methyltransferase
MQTAPTSYDAVAYPSYTHPQTHPDRLAVIGGLFGLKPAPPQHCRVLELGCGNGTNLNSMAWTLPQSEFVGIDLAAAPIQTGNHMIHSLNLKNARLVHGSIAEIDASWGRFDYIIAHGLYSWIPANVRDHIFRISHELLAPHGIAFVSYNALPGCHLRNMLREMMLFHVRGFDSPAERLQQATAFVRFLADAQDTPDEYRLWVKAEARNIADHDEGHLFHDELGEINDPLYFTQFIDRAAQHGLQYLGEADYFEMSDHIFKEPVRQTLTQLSHNRILREQYLDFLKCRRFRQTLLCHQNVPLQREPTADKLTHYYISSAAECTGGKLGSLSTYESPRGAKIETDFALGQAALLELDAVWPQSLPFGDLATKAATRLGNAPQPSDAEALRKFLLQLYAANIVEFRASTPTFTTQVSDRPVANPIARWQATHGDFVTSLFHIAVKVEDEIGRHLLTWLDGTHDHAALTEKLWELLRSKNALNNLEGNERKTREMLAGELDKNLKKLARFGLLVS